MRQIQIDLDPQALQADHLSAQDLENALAAQNQIIPAGTIKVGQFEYNVKLNNSPSVIDQLNNLPIKQVNGATIYIRDVGHVHDGSPPQTNIVRMDGRRGVLMTILKSGYTSTLDIVEQCPGAAAPPEADLAAIAQDLAAGGSVHLRARRHFGRGARRRHRRRAHRPDDPALPGKLALDPDHRDLDPAGDPVFAVAAVGAWARPSTS